jgi:Histidinol-phosphate/aromatic aminotransferase and cobyric acid decarboxylase
MNEDEKILKLIGFPKIKAKLDQNESPFNVPEEILNQASETLKYINYYPTEKLYDEIRYLYSEYAKVDVEKVWVAPGVDLFFDEYFFHFKSKGFVASPRPTFFLFEKEAYHMGYEIIGIKLKEPEFKIEINSFLNHVKQADFCYIDNPNNPTGNLIIEREGFEEIAKLNKPVLLDEAYYEFCNNTFIDLIENYEYLGIIRTLSKVFCLAGARISILITGKEISKIMNKDILRFRLSTISLVLAKLALENRKYIHEVIQKLNYEREKMIYEINKLGLKAYKSYTNFILIYSEIDNLAERLKEKGILVKDVSFQMGKGYIRVSVGDEKTNEYFIKSLKELLES